MFIKRCNESVEFPSKLKKVDYDSVLQQGGKILLKTIVLYEYFLYEYVAKCLNFFTEDDLISQKLLDFKPDDF